MIVELKLSDLVIPQGLLPRVLTGTIPEVVEKYKQMMEDGVEFDPIKVWKRGREYWVIDGIHRLDAARQVGKTTLKAEIVELKDETEYRIEAIKANLKHGVALQEAEKKILAQILFEEGLSKEEIRKIFGVGEKALTRWLSDKLKEKVKELKEKGYSVREIEKELGIGHTTVSRWINESQFEVSHFDKMGQSGNFSQEPQAQPQPQSQPQSEPASQKVEIVIGETRKEQIPEEQAKVIVEFAINLLKNPYYEFVSWAKVARDLINLKPEWEKSPGFFKLENFLVRNSSALFSHYEMLPPAKPEQYTPIIQSLVKKCYEEHGKKILNDKGVWDWIQDRVEEEVVKLYKVRITSAVRQHIREVIAEEITYTVAPPKEIEVKPASPKKEPEYQDPKELLERYITRAQEWIILIIDKFGWEVAEEVLSDMLEAVYNRDIRDWKVARANLYVERKIRVPYDRPYRRGHEEEELDEIYEEEEE